MGVRAVNIVQLRIYGNSAWVNQIYLYSFAGVWAENSAGLR